MSTNTSKAPLKELTAEYKKYEQTSLKYPGTVDSLAHLMMFNINVNEFSSDTQRIINPLGSGEGAVFNFGGDTPRNQVLRERTGGLLNVTRLPVDAGRFGKTSRKTVRIQSSIALYVPETMIFDDNQSYVDLSITKEFGTFATLAAEYGAQISGGFMGALFGATAGGLVAMGQQAVKALQNRADDAKLGGLTKSLTEGIAKAAGAAVKLSGFAVNPMIEVIYNNPNLRQFQFDFNFAPRTKEEAKEVGEIIKTFRRHQAPEFNTTTGIQGAVFLPPSEFDISFHYNTGNGFTENLNFPRISTCVLKTVNTNFAPNIFSTFRDGSSVNITLRLAFQELDMITRDRVDAGF